MNATKAGPATPSTPGVCQNTREQSDMRAKQICEINTEEMSGLKSRWVVREVSQVTQKKSRIRTENTNTTEPWS